LFMALLALLYTRTFYGTKRLFSRLPVSRYFRPAIGAFLTGLVGLSLYLLFGRQEKVLAVLAFGYSSIQGAMTGDTQIGAILLLTIALGKILTTSLTIASGGSGGVFGPSIVIGGCGGGALGVTLHNLWPALVPHPAAFVIVGMAGFFAAAAKTPFSTLIIVSELTGGYNLLLPSLWVCALSFILSDEQSIFASQVESRSRSPAHQGNYMREVLGQVHIGELFSPRQETAALHPADTLDIVVNRLSSTSDEVLPVVNAEGRLLGVVGIEEVSLVSNEPALRPLVLAEDFLRTDIQPLTPDSTLDHALELFVESGLPALPVVNDLNQRQLVGMVRHHEIASSCLRRAHNPASIE